MFQFVKDDLIVFKINIMRFLGNVGAIYDHRFNVEEKGKDIGKHRGTPQYVAIFKIKQLF